MTTTGTKAHAIKWWVVVREDNGTATRLRHTAHMRGEWAYDATCSCGWDSRTGGAVKRYVADQVWMHKHGFDA